MIRYTPIIILFSIIISGCEIITIGTPNAPREEVVNYNQNSALGAFYLFKTELDSNNVPAATQILADSTGELLLAIDKYERYFEIARIQRKISKKPITKMQKDTISQELFKYNVEFDYLTNMVFTASKIKNSWYIINYNDQ